MAAVEQRGSGRQVLRVVISLAALIGLAYLLLISVVLAAIQCGDGCGGAIVGPEHWQWTAHARSCRDEVTPMGGHVLRGWGSVILDVTRGGVHHGEEMPDPLPVILQ